MKHLSKLLLSILLLTAASVGWATECPVRYKNNYKGDCVVVPVLIINYGKGQAYKGQIEHGNRHGQGTFIFGSEANLGNICRGIQG